jgi:hypothetical protein
MEPQMALDESVAERFVQWLESEVVVAARGDRDTTLTVEPSGKYWLGRLAPEAMIAASGAGDRGDRLEPCAIGIRIKPADKAPWNISCCVSMCCWLRQDDKATWSKTERVSFSLDITVLETDTVVEYGEDQIKRKLAQACRTEGLAAEIRVEIERSGNAVELVLLLVNTSPAEHSSFRDTRLYECALTVTNLKTEPFILEALPDSFRYDRRVPAYGINCGVEVTTDGSLHTSDTSCESRPRPRFWSVQQPEPDFSFEALEANCIPGTRELATHLEEWRNNAWSEQSLISRANQHGWSQEMLREAKDAATEFDDELKRVKDGVSRLETNDDVRRAFQLMNKAMRISAAGRYDRWRPFQLGFLLANLTSIVETESETDVVDIVWFATGGGKTETYLGLIATAALLDRMQGKTTGITAWSRFPLRMLSLQQVQRFANAIAATELVRQEHSLGGDPFSLGFFVGQGSTPNSIKIDPDESDPWDADDEQMPNRARILQLCPFCRQDSIVMNFNRVLWRLEHQCKNETCPWLADALPFYLVDDEIFRFLPTVIVGTLDKAASISRQASMRAFVAAPRGACSRDGHGYVYAVRSARPNGCLVPGCDGSTRPLQMNAAKFAPSFRLQDELHLLRDSLGAVDAHYEALYDGLQRELCGRTAKVLGSSATLAGYEKQSEVLYQRRARVFPQQGPSVSEGFWVSDSNLLMRRYIAVAPRGVTIEYAVDRILTELQHAVRRVLHHPDQVCAEIGVPAMHASELVSIYGTDVVYGNTLRDLDAVMRSTETQILVEGRLNVDSLTGRTEFEQVRQILERLEKPEEDFEERLHVISASSMMSHGVDIDRLNVMVMLGLPLTTAEFIQATARVGRRWPGLVFVIHKIGRERDASVFRNFAKYVSQGDRFVEPVPISRRSRRVLEQTVAGLELARLLMIHEPQSTKPLTTLRTLSEYMRTGNFSIDTEVEAIAAYLGLTSAADQNAISDLRLWLQRFRRNVEDPLPNTRFVGQASPTGEPMLSLRDVEEQVPIFLNRAR